MEERQDLISRQGAIDAIDDYLDEYSGLDEEGYHSEKWCAMAEAKMVIENLPSAQPERTEYIPDTKAVRSKRGCVDLAERVTATFYDQEYEEWTQQTVTIADVLDSVCDEYTILPSAQPDIIRCKDCKYQDENWRRVSVRWLPCMEVRTGSNWYCGSAERRTDEQ